MRRSISFLVLVGVAALGCNALLGLGDFHDCTDAVCDASDGGDGGDGSDATPEAGACSTDDAGASVGCSPSAPVCSHGACASVKSLAHGGLATHSCAVLSDGHVRCWGTNYAKQLGAAATDGAFPVEVPGIADVAEVAVGNGFTCARTTSGDVSCWGTDLEGELGDDGVAGNSTATPSKVTLPQPAIAISSGDGTCAALSDGSVWCWGENGFGELGCPSGSSHLDEPIPYTTPFQLTPDTGFAVAALAVGSYTACFSSAYGGANDDALCYGDPRNGLADDVVVYQQYCWVTQNGGVQFQDDDGGGFLAGAFDVLSSGDGFTCGIQNLAGVPRASCWGENDFGQVDGVDEALDAGFFAIAAPAAAKLDNLGIHGITHISAGRQHACSVAIVGNDGGTAVQCWGRGTEQEGTGEPFALEVAGLTDVIDLAAHTNFTCALQKSGVVACWGEGAFQAGPTSYQLLANGSADDQGTPTPVRW